MIFAVAMTFIDQTIVSIAAATIQNDLGLSSSGIQWAINAYLLTLAALFAFGGRLADIVGHRVMVVIGVIIFAGASALCGATPQGSGAEAWLITFRAVQGLGGALMFPAAIAIVVQTFDLRSRGRALALFFGIAGALTAVGPIAGGYLIEWTWRAIFWINIPVALIALILIALSRPPDERRPAPIDYRGLVLIVGGVGLSVFGFQQSALWGWGNPAIWLCIAAGVLLLIVFFAVERRTRSPLINVRIFENRTFSVQNVMLGWRRWRSSRCSSSPAPTGRSRSGRRRRRPASHLVLLPRLRGLRADRRPDAGPGRGQAAGGDRLRRGDDRVRALGREGGRPERGRADGLHRHGRGRHGADARPVEHRRDQPGLALLLWRGDRHHPDRPQLRRQPRLRHPRHGPDQPVPVRDHQLAHQPGRARPGRRRRSVEARPAPGRRGNVATIPPFIRADFASAIEVVLYGMAIIMGVAGWWRCAASAAASRKTPQQPEPGSATSCLTKTRAPTSTRPGA